MAEKDKTRDSTQGGGEGGAVAPAGPAEAAGSAGAGSTATAKPKRAAKKAPKKQPPGMLPPWKVLLHNDNKNIFEFVIATICELTPLNQHEAGLRTVEAHKTGVALLLVTHRERAELYKDQFESKGLTVTIEPAEKG